MANTFGLILFTCLAVPVYCAQTECHFTIYDPNSQGPQYTNQKSCFFGCCSTTTYEPCCDAPANNNSLGAGAIGGIVIGVIIALIIFGATMFLCYRYNNKKDNQGEKYMTPEQPAVSYITTSEVTDVTDLSRLPPMATYDDDSDYPDTASHRSKKSDAYSQQNVTGLSRLPPVVTYDEDGDYPDTASHRSKKSDAYSQQSESRQYARPTNLPLNSRTHNSTSSMNSRDGHDGNSNRRTGRAHAPSMSSVDSMEQPPRQYHPKPSSHSSINSPSSVDSMDRSPNQRRRESRERREEPRSKSPGSRGHRERQEHSPRSPGSRDHHHRQNRPPHHSRGYANSVSSNESRDHRHVSDKQSVTSAADSIGTTV